MKVGVIGGSYGGLCGALALRCVGHDVEVFERSLEAFGYARPESAGVPTTRRRFLRRDGSVAATTGDSVFYAAWDTLLGALRAAFDASHIHNAADGIGSWYGVICCPGLSPCTRAMSAIAD